MRITKLVPKTPFSRNVNQALATFQTCLFYFVKNCERESPAIVMFQVVKTGLTALDALLFQFHGHYEKK